MNVHSLCCVSTLVTCNNRQDPEAQTVKTLKQTRRCAARGYSRGHVCSGTQGKRTKEVRNDACIETNGLNICMVQREAIGTSSYVLFHCFEIVKVGVLVVDNCCR